MTIAHLFNKVYLSFDALFQPAFDTIVVSNNYYSPHDSFINNHISMGDHYGRFTEASKVSWTSFFAGAKDRRTIVYADPLNFATVYFSLLKTINPDISKANAIKLLEVVLKRAEFQLVDYDIFVGGLTKDKKDALNQSIIETREHYNEAWTASSAFELDADFVQSGMGLEFAVARYWANGQGEAAVKSRLEQMWWKAFVNWGEEFMKWYTITWMHENPNSNQQLMFAQAMQDPDLAWIADPNLSLGKAEEFRSGKNWSTIEKIYKQITSSQHNGIVVELHQHWDTVVAKDWSVILDKSNPLTLLAVGTEPGYRMLVNSWLISYFAAQTTQTLGEMVL